MARMTRERAIKIVNEERADIGDMDAAVGWVGLPDEEVIEAARLIMIDRIKAVARYCGSELTDEEARAEWMATETADGGNT